MKSPLAIVKEKFGDKAKLVEAVKALTTEDLWLGRTSADRGGDRGLERVSNAKLLRLHAVLTEVKEKFGTRAKLVDEILAAEKRSKDAGLRKRLEAYPVPRLYDLLKTAQKHVKSAAKTEGVIAQSKRRRPESEKGRRPVSGVAPFSWSGEVTSLPQGAGFEDGGALPCAAPGPGRRRP